VGVKIPPSMPAMMMKGSPRAGAAPRKLRPSSPKDGLLVLKRYPCLTEIQWFIPERASPSSIPGTTPARKRPATVTLASEMAYITMRMLGGMMGPMVAVVALRAPA